MRAATLVLALASVACLPERKVCTSASCAATPTLLIEHLASNLCAQWVKCGRADPHPGECEAYLRHSELVLLNSFACDADAGIDPVLGVACLEDAAQMDCASPGLPQSCVDLRQRTYPTTDFAGGPGAPCSGHWYDCLESLSCVNGACAVRARCDDSSPCPGTAHCGPNGFCIGEAPEGTRCDPAFETCAPGLHCLQQADGRRDGFTPITICSKYIPEGGACISSDNADELPELCLPPNRCSSRRCIHTNRPGEPCYKGNYCANGVGCAPSDEPALWERSRCDPGIKVPACAY